MSRGIRVHERKIKQALRRGDLSGTFVIGKYRLAPYMACEHGCAYCDGRAERYWVEGDFDRDIVARTNLPSVLADELPKLRERGIVTIGSGITDAYQPLEEELKLTRECAKMFAAARVPVTLLTKSSLVLRDLDIWSEVNAASRFTLAVSLIHTDDRPRSWIEPGASSVAERLRTLREFKEAGCSTGVLAMPLLPGLHDNADYLSSLYAMLAETGTDFIFPGGLTLRPGRQKDYFMQRLQEHRPDLVAEYEQIFASERASGSPDRRWAHRLHEMTSAANRDAGVSQIVPHTLYKDILEPYDELQVLLHQMQELYETQGVDTSRLRASTSRLMGWLAAEKPAFNRHRSWSYGELSDRLFTELDDVLQNRKLAAFAREHVGPRTATFDPVMV